MNNSDSTKIFISLKLIPQRRDGTFFPFVHFQEACYIFLQKLYPLFQNSKNPEDIHPLLGEILLILSADTEKRLPSRAGFVFFMQADPEAVQRNMPAGRLEFFS